MTVSGRLIGAILLTSAVAAGAAMYWLQVYAFYREIPAAEADLSVTLADGQTATLDVTEYRGIDAESSPIRYRACFRVADAAALVARAAPAPDPVPLNAPGWFDCFDASALGAAIEAGEVAGILLQANIVAGVDRVALILPDGRGFAWHQPNELLER